MFHEILTRPVWFGLNQLTKRRPSELKSVGLCRPVLHKPQELSQPKGFVYMTLFCPVWFVLVLNPAHLLVASMLPIVIKAV